MKQTIIAFIIANIFIGYGFMSAKGHEKETGVKTADTTGYRQYQPPVEEDLNDIFAEKIDSLVESWYVKNAFVIDSADLITTSDSLGNTLPDSIYIKRLQALNSFIDLSYNKTVKNFIELYTKKRREMVGVMLGLSSYYYPMFEEALDKYELPIELKYLPVIESALNPRARSRVGATGLWQFMYGSGKMYGLEINSFVDERRDPMRSTDAAVRYLKKLYEIYGDWHLVIAAYNCGPGNVNKAIRRSGGARDYWKIYYRLPRETRGYVPAFIAAVYVMNYYQAHGITPEKPEFQIVTDTIKINSYLNLKQVAATLNMPLEQLRDYNPQYRVDIIPAKPNKPYMLKMPYENIGEFIDRQEEVFAYKRNEFFPDNKIKQPSSSKYQYTPVDIKGKDKVFYTVKSGDNLGYIGSWFHVRLSDVRYWNNIRRNLIRAGQRLVIYVPKGKGEYYKKFNTMSFAQKQQSIGKTPSTVTAKAKTTTTTPDTGANYIYHTVRRNESLWLIARKYPGISAENIMQLNNIKNAKRISPGQRLKIKRKS